jgi:hypothetical protein
MTEKFFLPIDYNRTNQTASRRSMVRTMSALVGQVNLNQRLVCLCLLVSVGGWTLDSLRGCRSGSRVESRENGAISPSSCIIPTESLHPESHDASDHALVVNGVFWRLLPLIGWCQWSGKISRSCHACLIEFFPA